jgi:glycosyltransferase involved in cell wall biosynthesis
MRIAFYGNYCNFYYQLAKALRTDPDLDIHLYIDSNADLQQRPESDDPALASGYPDWIHTGPYSTLSSRLAPWRSPLVTDLARSDLAVVSGFGPMFAQFAGVPYVFHTAGGDSTLLPFYRRSWTFYPNAGARIDALYTTVWQRRGIRRAREIWTHPFAPFQTSLRRIVTSEHIARGYFQGVVDMNRFSPDGHPHDKDGAVAAVKSRFDFVVFHPTRMMLRDGQVFRETGQWKRNDVLFRAFAKFVHETQPVRAGLVMIDRAGSFDVAEAKRMIQELGISDHVLWLQPPRSDGFTRDELIDLYSISDVVADQFGAGFFGYVVLEGLSLRRPVLSVVDASVMDAHYAWHPILSSDSVDGNASFLARLYREPQWRDAIGADGRRWVGEYHSFDAARRTYGQRLREIRQQLQAIRGPGARSPA